MTDEEPPLIARLQAKRDELRDLLLKYFEYIELIQKTTNTDSLRVIRSNFRELKLGLNRFYVFHRHLGSFIPDLLNEDEDASRDALQYLLTLLPETPPVRED